MPETLTNLELRFCGFLRTGTDGRIPNSAYFGEKQRDTHTRLLTTPKQTQLKSQLEDHQEVLTDDPLMVLKKFMLSQLGQARHRRRSGLAILLGLKGFRAFDVLRRELFSCCRLENEAPSYFQMVV